MSKLKLVNYKLPVTTVLNIKRHALMRGVSMGEIVRVQMDKLKLVSAADAKAGAAKVKAGKLVRNPLKVKPVAKKKAAKKRAAKVKTAEQIQTAADAKQLAFLKREQTKLERAAKVAADRARKLTERGAATAAPVARPSVPTAVVMAPGGHVPSIELPNTPPLPDIYSSLPPALPPVPQAPQVAVRPVDGGTQVVDAPRLVIEPVTPQPATVVAPSPAPAIPTAPVVAAPAPVTVPLPPAPVNVPPGPPSVPPVPPVPAAPLDDLGIPAFLRREPADGAPQVPAPVAPIELPSPVIYPPGTAGYDEQQAQLAGATPSLDADVEELLRQAERG